MKVLSRLTCPYCYLSFPRRKIQFRCSGQIGASGKCELIRDHALFDRFGIGEGKPPTFPANGRRAKATHKDCASETTHRVCPHCHSRLPVDFDRVDNKLIAMIGAKHSGKTVYMTVLLHELMYTFGRRFDALVLGSDDHTRKQFEDRFERGLYGEHVLPDITRSAGTKLMQPLVFKVGLARRKIFRESVRHNITSFFDTAGEDLVSQEMIDLNTRYLRSADGVILLLDPLQMRGAREQAQPGSTGTPAGVEPENPLNVLSRVTDLLRTATGIKPSQKIKVPIAIAFSKIDALWDSFPADSPLLQDAPDDQPALDVDDIRSVHDHVRALLHTWDGAQIDQLLRVNYATYSYFGLSALGATPEGRKVADGVIRPHRVQDPYLWLLRQFKFIPERRS